MPRSLVRNTLAVLLAMTVAVSLGILLAPTASSAAVASPSPYLLTLGDSYSIGYQPGIGGTSGYTGYLASALNLQAENFGCGGATTTSLLQSVGCGDPASQDGVSYPSTTQEQAALSFIAAHPGAVSLITVSIGGNDFDACSTAPCVQAAMPTMEQNVKTLMGALSSALIAASDTGAKIIGLTYPDVNLGLYVYPAVPPTAANVTSAQTSVTAFDDLINPTLSQSYLSVPQGSFVNVTSAPYESATSGDDTPLSVTEQLAPYGTVPVAVGEICQLTYFCSQGNIHATTAGYTFIGTLALADYQALTSPPIITQQPVSHVVASGSSGTYTATASGVPTPAVQWQLSVNGGSTWTNIGGATSTTFVTAALSTAVNGWQLRAIFTNSAGTATSSAVVVTVAAPSPPVITQQPVSHVVASGSSGTYTATASGVPIPTVQWQLSVNGGSTWTNIGGATSTTFVTAALSTAVNGWQLRAIFTNSAGTATSSAVVVTVSST